MKSRIARAIELQDYRMRLQLDNEKKRTQLEKMKSQIIMVLANMIDTRDEVTGLHVHRVSAIVETLVKKMRSEGMYPEFLDEVWYVYADSSVRIRRLMESRGYTEEKCKSIMAAQKP